MSTENMKALWKGLLDIGIRSIGTSGNIKAGEYIYEQLSRHIGNVSWDNFEFDGWHSECKPTQITVNADEKRELTSWVFMGSGKGYFAGTIKKVGVSHVWNMYLWDRYAVIENGSIVAYIVGRDKGGALSQTLIEGNSTIPNVIISEEENAWLKYKLMTCDAVTCSALVTCEQKLMRGRNILARFVPPDPIFDKRVIVCAHYDSMYNTIGAYDNAAGVVVLLKLAEWLVNSPVKRPVDIVFMDAEEWSLAGSRALAQKEKPDEIAYILNVDGVGSCDDIEVWCGRQAFEKKIMELVMQNKDTPNFTFINPPKRGSDHVPYYDRGIDCVMYTFNEQDIIHTPDDIYNENTLVNMTKMLSLVQTTLLQIPG